MNTELRKSFVELKKVCKTANQRKAYNKLVKSFSDEDPNPELGAKWEPDKLLEGLNYDNEDHEAEKTFAKLPEIYFVISKENKGVCIYTFGPGQTFDPSDEKTKEGLLWFMKTQYKDYDIGGPMTKNEAKSLANELANKYNVKVHANPYQAKGWLKR